MVRDRLIVNGARRPVDGPTGKFIRTGIAAAGDPALRLRFLRELFAWTAAHHISFRVAAALRRDSQVEYRADSNINPRTVYA
jgi:hypothetical protein